MHNNPIKNPLGSTGHLKERLSEEKGLCLLVEGQPRGGQPGFQWEGVPETKGAATEKAPLRCETHL